MADFNQEYKKWIGWIQSLELEKVENNIKILENLKIDTNINKYLFKLLLYLSHCADRCSKEKLSKEDQIFVITDSICKQLKYSSDKIKLFSALYYIVNYLLSKQKYLEAKLISKHLLSGNTIDPQSKYESSQYYQLASLWHVENFKKLDLLLNNSNAEKRINSELVNVILFHLLILQHCDETSCYVFKTSEMYVKKLIGFPSSYAFEFLLKLFKYLANYLKNLQILSIAEAYNRLIPIISFAFFKRNDLLNNSSILSYFRQCDSYFFDIFVSASECRDCYKFFREFSINLFETNFMSNEIGKSRFKKCLDILEKLKNSVRKSNTDRNIIAETITAMAYSYDTLFLNWEKLVARKLCDTNLTYSDIKSMSKYIKYSHSIMENRSLPKSYECKKCPDPAKCSLKKDIYCACVATSTFIKVLSKFPLDAIDAEVFSIANVLIKKLISCYYEVDKLGCKYSVLIWEITGRLIFNFGIITESKYPGELEELYEVFCKEIVRIDGLKSQTNNFGLENPLATALHRLCTSNFNREKYREAMSFTAYNALLSTNESRKKKAYDMWVNIKLKLIDSRDIQELTLLKCLKTDTKVIKKFGIHVDINDYNLRDLCLTELKFLSQGKGNLITSMKQTLAELETMDSTLHFAQGVFLLSCHVLQLQERESISYYIEKAISMLKSNKSKTVNSQWMVANLHFYEIVEKLYLRSQAIVNQMDDVKFTIKAFKLLNNKQNDNDIEGVDDIVPTCGGINITEDKKCAKELLDVLVLWDNCVQKDVKVFKDWELQLTLETIVVCGEYCRLFKFKSIEEKVWKLAYKLATTLQDFATCVYVTSRSISLRCINDSWISESEKYVERIKNSSKHMELDIVSIFWLSLADFYFDCKKVDRAKVLIENVKSLQNYHMLTNGKVYIYSSDIQFRNYFALNENTSQEQYCEYLIDIHYLLISLYDLVQQTKFWKFGNVKYQIFCCEQIFESMSNIIVPMNSLLSYREVSMHLYYGMKIAHTIGNSIRIGQFLKYTCYIDLLRMQLNSCEATIQNLEHILCLENFAKSMKTAQKYTEEPNLKSSPRTRDQLRNASAMVSGPSAVCPGSPELNKKIFTTPSFLEHSRYCECFICTNLSYQSLTFSCIHLRAQLYSLLNYTNEAEQYFCGACDIKSRLEEKDSDKCRQYKSYKWKFQQSYVVDVILYMLDFSSFISRFYPDEKEDALNLIDETRKIAEKNDMERHCVTALTAELYFQHHFYQLKDKMALQDIFVPNDIPITLTNQPAEGCITPKQQIDKCVLNPRRRKSPPPLAIPVLQIDDTSLEEDEHEPPNTKKPGLRRNNRNVCRKILVDEIDEITEEQPVRRSSRLSKK